MSHQQRVADLLDIDTGPIPVVALESADYQRAREDAAALTAGLCAARDIRRADRVSGLVQFSLEALHDMLSSANKDGGLTAAELKLANHALEGHCLSLQIEPVGLGVSLESFKDGVERVEVSLEELEEVIATVDQNHSDLAADASEWNASVCDTLVRALPDAANMLNVFLESIRDGAEMAEGDVDASGFAQELMCGDHFPSDLASYLEDYVTMGNAVVTDFVTVASRDAVKAVAFADLSFDDPDALHTQALEIASSIEDPRQCIGQTCMETPLPGTGTLFADDHDGVTDSDGQLNDLVGFALTCAPIDPDDMEFDDVDVPASVPTLSLDAIRKIGGQLHGLAMNCDAARQREDVNQAESELNKAIQKLTANYDAREGERSELIDEDIAVILQYMTCINTMAAWTPVFLMCNLVAVINAFLIYAKRSTKTEGESSVSTENISMEAGFKYRTGMRVKYSGGHGKIIKIFDRPTKYMGQVHHATRDNPKYEVRAEKGGKTSLHKASALTPV